MADESSGNGASKPAVSRAHSALWYPDLLPLRADASVEQKTQYRQQLVRRINSDASLTATEKQRRIQVTRRRLSLGAIGQIRDLRGCSRCRVAPNHERDASCDPQDVMMQDYRARMTRMDAQPAEPVDPKLPSYHVRLFGIFGELDC